MIFCMPIKFPNIFKHFYATVSGQLHMNTILIYSIQLFFIFSSLIVVSLQLFYYVLFLHFSFLLLLSDTNTLNSWLTETSQRQHQVSTFSKWLEEATAEEGTLRNWQWRPESWQARWQWQHLGKEAEDSGSGSSF